MVLALIVLSVIAAYLVGSIPTGYWFAKHFFGIDLTKHGSGNIGATNVARVLGSSKYFFLIFFIDAGKAILVLWAVWRLVIASISLASTQQLLLCGIALALLLGNAFSIFLKGKGGKSVATLVGIVAFIYPWWLVLVMIGVWGAIAGITRRIFIASIGAAVVAMAIYWFYGMPEEIVLKLFLTLATGWLIYRHSSNIKQFFAKG